MPELPEVETVRRGLARLLIGRRIESVKVLERRLRERVDERALAERVAGRRVTALSRRAKYLFVHLEPACGRGGGGDGGEESRLVVHLGMSGRLRAFRAGEPLEPHTHVVFGLDDGRELRFRDHRRFGLVAAVPASALEADARFRALGVEPLSRTFGADYLLARSRGVKKPVKNFLMDSRHVAGVGNIYACEALHLAGIHPRRAAGKLGRARWERLALAVKRVLRDAIRAGGTTLSDFQGPEGDAGYFQVRLRVYGREGERCPRCTGTVRRKVLAGRSTFYCPGCQR
jgi:formamidopyrimidine-DNA glycosylase